MALQACTKEREQAEIDDQKIKDYLNAVGWQTKEHQSGFYYRMTAIDSSCTGGCSSICSSSCGDGCIRPCVYSLLEFTHAVYDIDSLLAGNPNPVFSHLDSVDFQWVSDMIPAMQLGMSEAEEFTLGSSGFIITPSRLAYKDKGLDGYIAPNACLVIYVHIVESHPHF